MHDVFVPLVAAAAAFLAVLVWRVRPMALWYAASAARKERRAKREALRRAQRRIQEASDNAARARALCDAADIMATQVRRRGSASALYLRAVRLDPGSAEVVERAIAALARRPRALESLLWRHLATVKWRESPDATRAALDALRSLYEGRLRSSTRARALAQASELLVSFGAGAPNDKPGT